MSQTYIRGDAQQITQALPAFTHVICSTLICWVVSVFSENSLREWRLNHSIFPPSQTSALHFSNRSLSHPLLLPSVSNQHSLPRPRYILPEESTHTLRESVKQSVKWTLRVSGSHRRAAARKHTWHTSR